MPLCLRPINAAYFRHLIMGSKIMGLINFEGDPPFNLPLVKNAEARAVGEVVELVLYVSLPNHPAPVPVCMKITADAAMELSKQLLPAATTAFVMERERH
jgi:hypothetical protein